MHLFNLSCLGAFLEMYIVPEGYRALLVYQWSILTCITGCGEIAPLGVSHGVVKAVVKRSVKSLIILAESAAGHMRC